MVKHPPGWDGRIGETLRLASAREKELSAAEGANKWGVPLTCNAPRCDPTEGCVGKACCSVVMLEGLKQLTGWLDRHDIDYVLLQSTLLGAVRNQLRCFVGQ